MSGVCRQGSSLPTADVSPRSTPLRDVCKRADRAQVTVDLNFWLDFILPCSYFCNCVRGRKRKNQTEMRWTCFWHGDFSTWYTKFNVYRWSVHIKCLTSLRWSRTCHSRYVCRLRWLASLDQSPFCLSIIVTCLRSFVTSTLKDKSIIAAGHKPAADHILERFEIFRSMVPWFHGSMVNLWLQHFFCLFQVLLSFW